MIYSKISILKLSNLIALSRKTCPDKTFCFTIEANFKIGKIFSREEKSNMGKKIFNFFFCSKNIISRFSCNVSGYLILIILLASFCLPTGAYSKIETDALEEIVVTATRYEERLTNVPANVTIITEDDIKNSTAKDIPDLLRNETGIFVSDVTGNRRSIAVDIRGFGETGPSNTLVLVDGRRTNQADLSGVDWSQIPLDRVKRIEIIRGAKATLLYGDNATGGVINIITKEYDSPLAGAGIAAGSYNTFKTNAYANLTAKNLNLFLSGSLLKSSGYRDNSETESKDLGINLNYYLKDTLRLGFSAGYHKDNTGLPGALKESELASGISRRATTKPFDFADTEDYYFKFSPELQFKGENSFRIDFSFRSRAFLSYASGDWGNFTGDSEIQTISISPSVLLKNKIGSADNKLVAGFDYHRFDNDIINDSLFFGTFSKGIYKLQKKNYGFYIHDELRLTEPLFLSAGYRYDKAEFHFEPSTPRSVKMSKNLLTGGINYTFYKKSYIYLSYSKGFRYPLLDEIYSFFTNTINTNLKTQSSDTYEIGVRHYFSDNIYSHLNLFGIKTEREIIYNPITYNNENLDGKTSREGIEFILSAKLARWLLLKSGYTYTRARIKDGSFADSAIPNVPQHKASAEVVTTPEKGLTLSLNGLYVGTRPFISDFPNDFDRQKSYILINCKLKYQWKNILLFLDINNITNTEYSEYGVIGGFPLEKTYYPSPKRNFMAGISVEF